MATEHPLQVVGTINANHALLAKRAGFKAIYLSGGGVAAGSLGLPDLGISGLDDVLTDVRRIRLRPAALRPVDTSTPASALGVQRRPHGEVDDQVQRRRDAYRGPGRRQALRPSAGTGDRLAAGDGRPHQAAVDARNDDSFVIMARTDALAVEGLQAAIDRACAPASRPADMIFPEAMTELAMTRSSPPR